MARVVFKVESFGSRDWKAAAFTTRCYPLKPLRAGELPPIMRTLTDRGKRLEGRLRKRRSFLVDDIHYNNFKPLAFVIDLIFIFSETKRVKLEVAEQVQND